AGEGKLVFDVSDIKYHVYGFDAKDGKQLWVSSEIGGTVSVIDVATRKIIKKIGFEIPGIEKESIQPVGIKISADGKLAFIALGPAARVAVIKHLDGICHVYIDDKADAQKAFAIALNAKTHRYGVCNAMETLLVAEGIAEEMLPKLVPAYWEKGVELRGCKKTCELISRGGQGAVERSAAIVEATQEDWGTEYLAPVLSVRIVSGLDEAIEHINCYSSQHTDAIVTESITRAHRFLTEVDSSSVIVNASTRFADGFEYGLGAEIGISTDKIHARGPVGLEGLTSEKWVVFGDGHIRQ
ncbi:MAG: glutamate-5-semialdehyde dehydrogenase, partial [Exilibacterium sp.]